MEKRTPLQLEIDSINAAKRKNEEVAETATKLISMLKSEVEGRGVVPEEKLNRRRKAFWAMVQALQEDE